jgi:iron(III) transport system permease protein
MALTPASAAPAFGLKRWSLAALAAALICATPALFVLAQAVAAVLTGRARLDEPQVAPALAGTVILVVVGTTAATLLGTVAAFLTSQCRFPGRGLLSWMLVLPLAAPAYVLAYAYGALTGPLGPFPIGLSGLIGAGFVYVIGFYPYAYLAARAAFALQSVCAVEAARSLGASSGQALMRVTLPLAWPAIGAGAALIGMEIAADYGAAAYFGAQTLSTDLFRAWYAHTNLDQALLLAGLLLSGALGLLLIERALRGQARAAGGSTRWRTPHPHALTGVAALAATGFCALLSGLGAVIPLCWLVRLAAFGPADQIDRLIGPLINSVGLAAAGAACAFVLAVVIARSARRHGGDLAASAGSIGYAAPGAVMALGGLMAMGLAADFGLAAGVGAAAALIMLIWIYAARFAAAGVGPIGAGLNAATPNLMAAARTLGAGRVRSVLQVEAPIAAPALLAAALLLFVEILKELPATLILRPFDFDTLAVIAHSYAADDRLNAAALPALLIVAAGLAPVIVLTRGIARARAGAR